MTFREKLLAIQRQQHSLVCVGLDTDAALIPEHLRNSPDGVLEFNRRIIEATHDLVCAYKPNLAFYESLGSRGWDILHQTLAFIPAGIVTIGDAKRGDIGNTAERYAKALFDDLHFDAVTINAYLGHDAVEPFIRNPVHGAFVLALTSNPGSKDLQRQKAGTKPLYEKVARLAAKWNTSGNVGLVVGATHPRELKTIRAIAPTMPILIPGIGKQGGDLKSSVRFGCDRNGELAVINSSRGIIYASSKQDYPEAARAAATQLRDSIREFQKKFFRFS
ncbi:MAG TPA: orotidine-5'-phosphate decarboxylase [Bacteroidota bacterium]|nr:orotidine-5'-phosphate decarboxylase [Bacteroidota bacterium]